MKILEIPTTSVGTSSRTPYKHWLLNSMLGKVVGALSTGKTTCSPHLTVVDMCAGDGVGYGEKEQSSPSIIAKHINWPRKGGRHIESRKAHLFEIQTNTYDTLKSNFGSTPGFTIQNRDSKGWTLNEIDLKPRESVLVYADPNAITTLPVTPELIASFTSTTLFLMTLGYNVGGAKRLPREEREQWMKTAINIIDSTYEHHDILLVWLVQDKSQWAYLSAVPKVWSADTLVDSIIAGKKRWVSGVDGLSLKRHGRPALVSRFSELILTKSELETK